MEQLPLPDRIRRLCDLTEEHGGGEHIPEEALTEIGYDRYIDPESALVRLPPVERLGGMSIRQYVEANRPQEIFGKLSMQCESGEGYNTVMSAREINNASGQHLRF